MTDDNIHIIACHGWAFDSSVWDPIRSELESFCKFDTPDRGYFAEPSARTWDRGSGENIEKILIAHSYGLHWCNDDIIREADSMVLIGSFLHFHPNEENEYDKSKLNLRKMMAHFVEKPEKMLGQFYEDAFHPGNSAWSVPSTLNHDRLLSDLSDIDSDNRQNAEVFDMKSITIIHGMDDQFVSNDIARNMYSKLRLRSRYFEIVDAGHALPVTHSSKICNILESLFHLKHDIEYS